MSSYPSHIPQTPEIENRSRRITQLLPFVSGLRHSNDANSRLLAVVLQESIRDLERLNEIATEIACNSSGTFRQAVEEILKRE